MSLWKKQLLPPNFCAVWDSDARPTRNKRGKMARAASLALINLPLDLQTKRELLGKEFHKNIASLA